MADEVPERAAEVGIPHEPGIPPTPAIASDQKVKSEVVAGPITPLKSRDRWLYGGAGALAPLVVAGATSDARTIFADPNWIVVAGWGFRCFLLFLVGGFVGFLHRSETDAWRCFLIGIAAPALITTGLAGSGDKVSSEPAKPSIPGKPSSKQKSNEKDSSTNWLIHASFGWAPPHQLWGPDTGVLVQIQPKLRSEARQIDVTQLTDVGESGWDKFVRGFTGYDPTVSYILISSEASVQDAKIVAAAVKLFNMCADKIKDLERKQKKAIRSESVGEPFVITSQKGNFVLVPIEGGAGTDSYVDAIEESFGSQGVIRTRQSREAADLKRGLNPKATSVLETAKAFHVPPSCKVS